MIPPFDIFKREVGGAMRWLEAALDLDGAKARIVAVGKESPGEYLILSQRTGKRLVVKIGPQTETLSFELEDPSATTRLPGPEKPD